MHFLEVDTSSIKSVNQSFRKIAEYLFNNYILDVNNNFYRLIDIEFYYKTKDNIHKDNYTHGHETQLSSGKWYFHSSGIDITFGNNADDYGGILIRGIAKLNYSKPETGHIDDQIHGPVKVKAEICKNLKDAFDSKPYVFCLRLANNIRIKPTHIINTQRINLNPEKHKEFYESKYRYVILLNNFQFKYVNKTQIAKNLQEQFGLNNDEVNTLLGSKFL